MRRGMVPNPPPPEVQVFAGLKRRRDEHQPDAEPSILHMKLTPHHEYDLQLAKRPRYELVDRIHTEIFMPAGIVVKSFCHLHELIQTLVCGIEGEDNNAADAGVGNLLIFPVTTWDDEKTVTFGRLMDWDHAMISYKYINLPSKCDSTRPKHLRAVAMLRDDEEICATEQVFEEAYRYRTPRVEYVRDVAVSLEISQSEENPLTVASLGWDHEDIPWPDFKERVPQKGERTGTLPFISPEVLMQLSMYDANKRRCKEGEFRHNSVHDLESFLWVLVYICLTRKGPGIGMVRDELTSDTGPKRLRNVIRTYFDADEHILEKMKHRLFETSDTFESDIIASFHPYFDSLKPLVKKWWERICLAYRHHGNEYYHIHSHILRILNNALPAIPRSDNRDTVAEMQRRKDHHPCSLETIANLQCPGEGTDALNSPVVSEASPGSHRFVTDSTIQTSGSSSTTRKRQAR
ncbi:hypothetical protein D9615_007828 [Tricholomella constricta]|uniref:Fungal-type protein kinase domain-containing protein n=1 Tax=Tricholomella constricta TaxID=117010 RepID=A0A8H5H4V2_9AGAR|nr:hypothetical protein D9615_007828 [Tricholomella constricta]